MRKIGGGTIEGKSTRRTKVAGKVGRSRGGGEGDKAEKRGRSPQAQFLRGMRAIHFSTLSFVRSFERERKSWAV